MTHIQKRIKQGMVDLLDLFSDKSNPYRGLSKQEFVALYYKLPLKKVLKMKPEQINIKWQEIATVKKYLIKLNQAAIVHLPLSKGTTVYNKEFGERILDKRTNIFFKCVDSKIAGGIRDHYDRVSYSFKLSGDKIFETAREQEKEIPVVQQLRQKNI